VAGANRSARRATHDRHIEQEIFGISRDGDTNPNVLNEI
jgi:hypothetical protein